MIAIHNYTSECNECALWRWCELGDNVGKHYVIFVYWLITCFNIFFFLLICIRLRSWDLNVWLEQSKSLLQKRLALNIFTVGSGNSFCFSSFIVFYFILVSLVEKKTKWLQRSEPKLFYKYIHLFYWFNLLKNMIIYS